MDFALSSIGLYSLWLFDMHYTSKKLDAISYARVTAIEEALTTHLGYDFGVHSQIRRSTRKKTTEDQPANEKTEPKDWLRLRRVSWGIVLLLLSGAWLLLSLFFN